MGQESEKKPGMLHYLVRVLGTLAVLAACAFLLDIGCIFKHVTGLPCLGCGTTRACIAFVRGQFLDAFFWHPLFWLTLMLISVMVVRGGVLFQSPRMTKWCVLFLAAMYITVYIVRMVLLFPDTPPMDYNFDAAGYRIVQILLH